MSFRGGAPNWVVAVLQHAAAAANCVNLFRGKQLKWLYPTNSQAADKWLEQEVYRWGGVGWGVGGGRVG